MLPPGLRQRADDNTLHAATRAQVTRELTTTGFHPAVVRAAMREERKLEITYLDAARRQTSRKVWPLVLGFFDDADVLAAWCETRQDFRHFRIDRIVTAQLSAEKLPRRRRALVAEWRKSYGKPVADRS